MGGDNMESLLLHGDDSSSGESDSEIALGGSATASASMQRPTTSVPNTSSVASGPTHAPQTQPQGSQVLSQPGVNNQADMTARLKSMFSPASKSQSKTSISSSQPAQPMSSLPPSTQRPQPQQMVPQQLTQRTAQNVPISQQYQRSNSTSSSHSPHSSVTLPAMNALGHGQQSAPMHQRPMTSNSGGVTHQPTQSQQRRTSGGQPPPQPQGPPSFVSRGGIPQSNSTAANVVSDPFEPTPVSAIMERSKVVHPSSHPQHPHTSSAFPAPQPMMSSNHSANSSSSHRSSSGYQPTFQSGVPTSASSASTQRTATPSEREVKIYKERFLVFTRVLVKYLEQKNPALHQTVKAIIKECVERNKRQEPGYESVTTSMRKRLKEVVHDTYWKKAESYLDQFLKGKAKTGSSSAMALSGNVPPTATSAPPGTNPSPVDMRRNQEMERAQQMQQQVSASRSPQQLSPNVAPGQQQQLPPGPTVASVQQDIAKKRQSIGKAAAGTATGSPTPPAATTLPNVQQPMTSSDAASASTNVLVPDAKKVTKPRNSKTAPSTVARKTSIGIASGTTMPQGTTATETSTVQQHNQSPSSGTPQTPQAAPPPVREYSEFMELVDHAVYYDWTVAGLLMDKEQSEILSSEQQSLFDETKRSLPSKLLPSTDSTMSPDQIIASFPIPGWSRRNILSSRAAWALVRLSEEEAHLIKAKKPNAVVGDGLFTIPAAPGSPQVSLPQGGMFPHSWHNEQVAEEDSVLAVLSEGLQIYLRGVVEKAVHCARQRYNVDGVRLWHQQTSVALKAKLLAKESKSGNNKEGSEKNESITIPPLTLRLGCDVNRQVAQAAGNAAMTVKRMEEALRRLDDIPLRDAFTSETETSCLLRANSMSELALLPKLGKAVENADYNGKRCFEVYGGKFSNDPPLGRVPKQPKIELIDFQMGMNFSNRFKRRSRAGTMSSSFFF